MGVWDRGEESVRERGKRKGGKGGCEGKRGGKGRKG